VVKLQKKVLVTRKLTAPIDSYTIVGKKILWKSVVTYRQIYGCQHSLKYLLLYSSLERNS